jgi:hypothetical protein
MNPHPIVLPSLDQQQIYSFFAKIPLMDSLKKGSEGLLIIFALWACYFILLRVIRLLHDLHEPRVFFEITPPQFTEVSSTTTSELFSLLSGILTQRSLSDKLLLHQPSYSFEIVSRKQTGIQYLLRAPKSAGPLLERTLRSYLPGIHLRESTEYLPRDIPHQFRLSEFRLSKHFTLPLNTQVELKDHDPLSYLTGSMTQVKEGELMVAQLIVRPLNNLDQLGTLREIATIRSLIRHNRFTDWSRNTGAQQWTRSASTFVELIASYLVAPLLLIAYTITGAPPLLHKKSELPQTPAERELELFVTTKLSQPLFEATIRTLVIANKEQVRLRERGLNSSFTSFSHISGQSLISRGVLFRRLSFWLFKQRLSGHPLFLTPLEVGALYHFPHSTTTDTEDLIRIRSRELSAPLTLKNTDSLDVVFGKNTYGNVLTNIGLSDDDRSRHVYLLGQTGSGKSTVIYHMASADIAKGRGLAVIDPHGDLAEDLITTVPSHRANNLIYLNPFDIKYPVGINLLELAPTTDEDELELEKELICEGVISIFRRVFSKDEHTDAHRIEYILRNTIYTAFTVENCTIFTVYDLLNNPEFRKKTVKALTDENLKLFWKNEFGRAGDYQVIKMVGGVTAKVGRFLFSPVAKRILEQPKSTINFSNILDLQKILICNLSEGKIGEDTSQLLGTTIITKIQQAAVRRARQDKMSRIPFYLFVDEFQNFATSSFTKLLSGGRKFGLRVTIAEQSTAQQSDRDIVNVILANTGTVICFRTASPVDEELMLAQFTPSVERGDIGNLPRYHFYMRLSAIEPSAPFSGETFPVPIIKDTEKVQRLVELSRSNYATHYVRPKTDIKNPVNVQKLRSNSGGEKTRNELDTLP